MTTQKLDNLFKDPQTNWKYILIVIILAVTVGGGILGYQYWWLPRQEVEMPEIEIPEKPVEDETADWKTYRNEEYGLEVRYPNNYQVKSTEPRYYRKASLGKNVEPMKIPALESIELQPTRGHSVYLSIFNISQSDEWSWQTGGEGGLVSYEYNSSRDLWKVREGISFLIYGGHEDIFQEFTENYHTLEEIISSIPRRIKEKGGTETEVQHARSYLPVEIVTSEGLSIYRFSWGLMVDAGDNYIVVKKNKNIILWLEYIVCWPGTCKDTLTPEENEELFLETESIIKSVKFF